MPVFSGEVMNIEQTLMQRSDSKCELCRNSEQLAVYSLPESPVSENEAALLLCITCRNHLADNDALDQSSKHWHCLKDSMWSPIPAIQVLSYRLLHRLQEEPWAQDALDMLYLEDDIKAWGDAGLAEQTDNTPPTFDSNGAILSAGDTVTLIKDLDVKGANFTAKRGTAVRNISLTDNPAHIEGRVNGTRIVLLSQFLKKSN